MRHRVVGLGTALACLLATAGLLSQPSPAVTLAITGGTLIDGRGGAPVGDAVVIVSAGKIAAAGARSTVVIPRDATPIDAAGKFVVPGLVDTNVHLSLYGGVAERYETLAKYHPRQQDIVLEAAQLQLKHGVTTVRDSYGLLVPLVAVRDRIAAGRRDWAAHPRRRQHRRLGRTLLGQLQPDSRAGADALPGADERRGRRRAPAKIWST